MNQVFPVFDPISEKFLYFKERSLVHTDGDWHRGIQANIIRRNCAGTFDVLVQKRSASVDIGDHKFDTSLATQMQRQDKLNPETTLRRGLREELGLDGNFAMTRLNKQLRIVKTYADMPNTINRELLTLFIVLVKNDRIIESTTKKIEGLFWMEWKEFLKFFDANSNSFTKTAQFYLSNEILLREIEKLSYCLLDGKPSHDTTMNEPIMLVDRAPNTHMTYYGDLTKSLAVSGEDWLPEASKSSPHTATQLMTA